MGHHHPAEQHRVAGLPNRDQPNAATRFGHQRAERGTAASDSGEDTLGLMGEQALLNCCGLIVRPQNRPNLLKSLLSIGPRLFQAQACIGLT